MVGGRPVGSRRSVDGVLGVGGGSPAVVASAASSLASPTASSPCRHVAGLVLGRVVHVAGLVGGVTGDVLGLVAGVTGDVLGLVDRITGDVGGLVGVVTDLVLDGLERHRRPCP